MKKEKTYALLASLLLMLVATLNSCEKFALEGSSTNTHDANANVTIHVSLAPKTRDTEEIHSVEDYCSRLTLSIFDGEEKLKNISLTAEENGYGDIQLHLDKGDYRLVAIGHNGDGNCTISAPEKIKFYKNKMTDTFYYYGKLNVTEDKDTEDEIQLKRAVAQVKFHITDSIIPQEAHSIKFYYTGGSSTLDATTGYGCVNSRQTESFKLAEEQRDYSIFTFPHEENNGLKMDISILDSDAKSIKEYSQKSVPIKCNYVTKANISIQENTISDPEQQEQEDTGKGEIGFTVNPDWDGEIVVDFE